MLLSSSLVLPFCEVRDFGVKKDLCVKVHVEIVPENSKSQYLPPISGGLSRFAKVKKEVL